MRLLALSAALLLASGAAAQTAPDLAGTWTGTLETPGGSLTFVLNLTPEASGGYAATVDSPDQGVTGIAAEATVSGGALSLSVPAVGAQYEATLDGPVLTGTFAQGGATFPLELTRTGGTRPAPEAMTSPALALLVGVWEGTLMDALPLVLRLSPGAHPDTLRAILDSPSQGSFGNAARGAWLEGGRLVAPFPTLSARYEAEVRGDTLDGTWTQGNSAPLVLARASGESGAPAEAGPEAEGSETGSATPRQRPQDPLPPFPYREEELRVESAPGVTLAGTLTLPEGPGPFPAVVLVSGSGPQDRDETILGHRPFAVWADRLARAGIASARFDDRGTAESTGDWASATIADFSEDAASGVRALLAREDIAGVGVMGHSEGGYVAPHVARMEPRTAFVVLLAGPGVSGSEVYVEQQRRISEAQGLPADVAALYSEVVEALIRPYAQASSQPDSVLYARGREAARARLRAAPDDLRSTLLGGQSPEPTFTQLLDFVSTPGIGSFLAFNPREDLEALAVPALAVFGGRDLQVPPEQSAGPLAEALAASESPQFSVVTFAGLNHLFQPSETGRIEEYGQIETTVDEQVLSFVARWIAGLEG